MSRIEGQHFVCKGMQQAGHMRKVLHKYTGGRESKVSQKHSGEGGVARTTTAATSCGIRLVSPMEGLGCSSKRVGMNSMELREGSASG